jgi:hypothetical protein
MLTASSVEGVALEPVCYVDAPDALPVTRAARAAPDPLPATIPTSGRRGRAGGAGGAGRRNPHISHYAGSTPPHRFRGNYRRIFRQNRWKGDLMAGAAADGEVATLVAHDRGERGARCLGPLADELARLQHDRRAAGHVGGC